MKTLMTILVLALMVTGFPVASHAMAKADHTVSGTQYTVSDTDHADHDGKSAKGTCADCVHSCSLSVVLPEGTVHLSVFEESVLAIEKPNFLPESKVFSLLRPPKTFA